MILDNTNKSITVVLAGAKSANDANCFASYRDLDSVQGRIVNASSQVGNTNGTATATIVSAPPTTGVSGGTVSNRRVVDNLTIYNADTAAITASLQLTNGTTTSLITKEVLAVGDTLMYSEGTGFKVLTSSGATKQTQTGGSANQLKQTFIIPIGTLSLVADTNTYSVRVPFAFTILSAAIVADKPVSTGSKLSTFTVSTTGGSVTGGVMATTSANLTSSGLVVNATAISGANATQTAGAAIILTASSTTTYTEGTAHAEVTVSNNS